MHFHAHIRQFMHVLISECVHGSACVCIVTITIIKKNALSQIHTFAHSCMV